MRLDFINIHSIERYFKGNFFPLYLIVGESVSCRSGLV